MWIPKCHHRQHKILLFDCHAEPVVKSHVLLVVPSELCSPLVSSEVHSGDGVTCYSEPLRSVSRAISLDLIPWCFSLQAPH
jgi:hypothetical protein